jgi:hypothetical protein
MQAEALRGVPLMHMRRDEGKERKKLEESGGNSEK